MASRCGSGARGVTDFLDDIADALPNLRRQILSRLNDGLEDALGLL